MFISHNEGKSFYTFFIMIIIIIINTCVFIMIDDHDIRNDNFEITSLPSVNSVLVTIVFYTAQMHL